MLTLIRWPPLEASGSHEVRVGEARELNLSEDRQRTGSTCVAIVLVRATHAHRLA